ncbi:3-phosphoshikimate 1-carboxyvinyltransferase [Clostridium manihotivorum]|uniref:3-phosphoshikimate 1-carboxyvinyltransferase n=1 Tax=Clostridium manihotivorum TaxID=2320868 RepID=A0A3R5UHN9_9CLOT|nr:3-phosphoshikimate 1-carboxyvinyltransferase [Clostridium manihotivorum]QAA33963.1 3-phosphoshikimate 1-carboxyvinyltransferase [Clostridium manihotivorum]
MKKVEIKPKKLVGNINIPPSKSMAHRAIICAALAKGESLITNVDFSDDIIATLGAIENLGAHYEKGDTWVKVTGGDLKAKDNAIVDCNESGSTLRFIVPLFLVENNKVTFIGKGNLGKRPLKPYYEIFEEQSIEYYNKEGILELKINGSLNSGEFHVKGDISSQFISGLLFTLPLLKGDSKIIITTKLESKGYIDLTLDMLKKFGIDIVNNDYKEFVIKGNSQYKATNYEVEGDFSQSAFYLVASCLGNEVELSKLNLQSLQGDKEILDILNRMGANISVSDDKVSLKVEQLIGTTIDAAQCPDIIPVVAVAAALAKGTTNIINAGRLRIKECDRLTAIASELNKLGAKVQEGEDYMVIEGVESLKGGEVNSFEDHRIAMSLAIAATCCKEKVIIDNPQCVKKSYPGFWQDYKSLGGELNEWSVGQ